MMKLAFMTFVLPEYTVGQLVEFAASAGYDGVELRVDAEHKHDVSTRSSPETRQQVRQRFADSGVEIACIATSATLSALDPEKRKENLDMARRNIDLAADLGAGIIRTFSGMFVPEMTAETAESLASAYDELGEYGAAAGVCPMLECGHDLIKGHAEATQVIRRVKTANFGALWNYSEMDDDTLDALRSRLRHFHVHDEVLEPGNENIFHLARKVRAIGYRGYFSLEIIKFRNLPEEQLRETATRLKGQLETACAR